jgi:hypothetical protein
MVRGRSGGLGLVAVIIAIVSMNYGRCWATVDGLYLNSS